MGDLILKALIYFALFAAFFPAFLADFFAAFLAAPLAAFLGATSMGNLGNFLVAFAGGTSIVASPISRSACVVETLPTFLDAFFEATFAAAFLAIDLGGISTSGSTTASMGVSTGSSGMRDSGTSSRGSAGIFFADPAISGLGPFLMSDVAIGEGDSGVATGAGEVSSSSWMGTILGVILATFKSNKESWICPTSSTISLMRSWRVFMSVLS